MRLIDADALSEKLCETTIFIKDGEVFQRMINDAPTVSAEAEQVTGKLKKPCNSLLKADSDECKEQKSKLDLISRQDAIEAIEEITWYHQNRNGEMVSGANSTEDQAWYKSQDIYAALEALPSAEARPTGEWIFNTSTSNGKSWNVCSECGDSIFHPANFCPNCGAKMKDGDKDDND